MVHVLHWMKRNSTRIEAVATEKKVMTISKDDWKAVYAKDDDLKLTKAGGNKIRRTTTPPIFSSGMLDILLIE